jgi:hypothetical protein
MELREHEKITSIEMQTRSRGSTPSDAYYYHTRKNFNSKVKITCGILVTISYLFFPIKFSVGQFAEDNVLGGGVNLWGHGLSFGGTHSFAMNIYNKKPIVEKITTKDKPNFSIG